MIQFGHIFQLGSTTTKYTKYTSRFYSLTPCRLESKRREAYRSISRLCQDLKVRLLKKQQGKALSIHSSTNQPLLKYLLCSLKTSRFIHPLPHFLGQEVADILPTELRQGSLAEIEALKKKAAENKELLVWRDCKRMTSHTGPIPLS